MRATGKLIASLVIVLAIALVAAACGSQAPAAPAPSKAAEQPGAAKAGETKTILLGAPLPITGDLAPQGKEQRDGYDMFLEVVNNKLGGIKIGTTTYKFDIKYYNYESDVNTAVKLAEKLITEDKVNFLMGPYGSATIKAVTPIAEKYKIIHIPPSGANEGIYQGMRYTIGTLGPTREVAKAWVDMVMAGEPKPQTIALLSRNDLFPKDMGDTVKGLAEQAGLKVVFSSTYPVGSKDHSTALTQVKAANPDLFFFTGYANDAMLVINQAKQAGLKVKSFGATAGLTSPDFLEGMKSAADNVTTVETWVAELPDTNKDKIFGTTADYVKAFKAKFNYVPSYIQASSTAAGYVLVRGMEKAGSMDTEKIRDEIVKLDEDSFYGRIKFNKNGQLERPAYGVQIEYPGLNVLYPTELKTKKFVYPFEWK